ncbi:disease resistance RPP13-like protein 4 [Populus alba x Populus x berolinensis]|nr:disease resistance RPP13-like protein 4 [Populus alba x Populus x berolinensis]
MSIKRDPEKVVSTLQNRLYQAIDLTAGGIDERMKENELVLNFRSAEAKLEELKNLLSGHKRWEDTVVKKFNVLRLRIYKTLSLAKNQADGARQNANTIKDHLHLVDRKLDKLNLRLQPLLPLFPAKSDSESREKINPYKVAQERKVLKEWKELEVESIILESSAMLDLQASYHNLERLDLKLCFLFLSVFPEEAVIKKRPLIYWWIGEGLITANEKKTAEEEGESIFQELIEQDLIVPYHERPDKPSPAVNACIMHPWIRHMAISLAQKADLFAFDSSGTPSYGNYRSRRACLDLSSDSSSSGTTPNEENLLTVFNVSKRYLNFSLEWLLKLRKVAVLQLGRWHYLPVPQIKVENEELGLWHHSPVHHIEVENEVFLKGLWAQKHLKYLCLRGISLITTLPSSIGELFSLEILDLKACHNLEELPSEIGSLTSLTHLDVSDCPFLESMPKELQKLTRLQVLKGFVIGNSKRTPCKIADLADLKELRRLSIYIGNEAVVKEGEFAKLKAIEKLRCLTMWWGVKVSLETSRVKPEEKSPKLIALTDLQFPPGLEKLDLRGIPQPNPLKELKPGSLKQLKKLYIRGGKLQKLNHGEKDDHVWEVEILRLRYLKDFKVDKKSLKQAFPKLDYLDVICDQSGDQKTKYKEDFVLRNRNEIGEFFKEKGNSEEEQKNAMPAENEIREEGKSAESVLIDKGKGKEIMSESAVEKASSSRDHHSQ